MSVRAALREATHEAHERVDALFSTYDLADAGDYRRFLERQASAFLPCEAALTAAGAGALVDDWDAMRRGPLLLEDLAALGTKPDEPLVPPSFADPAAVLGGIYVLEGSRLGGAMLKRQVPASFPQRFLAHRQPQGRWAGFVALLERKLYPPVDLAGAIRAANEVFAIFERAGVTRE